MVDITGTSLEMIALRMRLWRKAINRSQMQIADKMGWKNGHIKIGNWEKGTQLPTGIEIIELNAFYPISVDYVFEGYFLIDHQGQPRMPAELVSLILGGAADEANIPFQSPPAC